MDPKVCFMNSSFRKALITVTVAVFLAMTGCSSAQNPSGRLQVSDIRPALRGLTFTYRLWPVKPPSGDDAAFRGVAHGKYGTTLHFSIGLGVQPMVVPIAKTKRQDPTGEGEAGFAFNSDSSDATKFKTKAQWETVGKMAVEIEERLCKKANGEPCPV